MKIHSLHKNLDTAFVNLSSLLRYLRERNFVGLVRIDIREYRAEIVFDEKQRVRMREFDHRAGMIAESGGGLQRLLTQATQPGGLINVYESVEPVRSEWMEIESGDILDLAPPVKETAAEESGVVLEPAAAAKIPKPAENIFHVAAENGNGSNNGNGNGRAQKTNGSELGIIGGDAPAARQQPKTKYLSVTEWAELTAVTAELLGTADRILLAANLGFTDAFNKARVEISGEYPLLDPRKEIFLYRDEKVMLQQEIDPAALVAGVSECLRRIMNKLVSNPKFFWLYKQITQQLHILVRQKQEQFDKFGYTRRLEGIMKL